MATSFRLRTPCKDCPYVPGAFKGLTRKRKQIFADALLTGDATFPCHKTISGVEDEETGNYKPGETDQHCAGALIVMSKEGKLMDNSVIRIAAIFGLFDPDKLDLAAPTYESMQAFVEDDVT